MSNSFHIPLPSHSLRERIEWLPEWETLPVIEVRVGSDSDLSKIKSILEWLKEYPVLVRIASAHRTPEAMVTIAKGFPEVILQLSGESLKFSEDEVGLANKLKVIACIACAWWSAHIAGMTASETNIPVLAFPVPSSTNGQFESDASMRDMPPGIPNGTSSFEAVVVDQAKKIYERSSTSSEKIYLAPWIEVSSEMRKLIDRLQIQITNILGDAGIGIFWEKVNDQVVQYQGKNRSEVEQAVLDATHEFGTPVVLMNPTYSAPIDTNDRSLQNIQRIGTLALNRLTVSGLSMGASVEGKTNFTNVLLFAAKIVALHNSQVHEALWEYRRELRDGVREKDRDLIKQQLQ